MRDYKGLYYNESKERKFFEGGAHFRYKDLFKLLVSLGGILTEDNSKNGTTLKNNNVYTTINKNINSITEKEKYKKSRPRTRNINNLNFINNPNTKISLNSNMPQKRSNLSINNLNHIRHKNFIIKDLNLFEEKITNNKNYNKNNKTTFFAPNTQRYHNNNLAKTLLNKKTNKYINEPINSNNNDESKNYNNLMNYMKYIHSKNKSVTFLKTDRNNSNNNNIDKLNKIKINKKIIYLDKNNLINIKKKIKINTDNINNLNSDENEKYRNIFNKKNNCLMIYSKSKINLSKPRLNTQINNFGHYIKKSRNIVNKNYLNYLKSLDNNENKIYNNNINYNLFNNIINKDEYNNNDISSTIYINNKTINSISVDKNTTMYNNKEKPNKNGKKVFQKYVKKKINKFQNFNKTNLTKNNGKKIISRNINSLNSGFNNQNIKYKTSFGMDNIN